MIRTLVLSLLVLMISGCATTRETHPARVSAGDLWWGGDRLDIYLKARRKELQRMQEQASALETRLHKREKQLAVLERQLNRQNARTAKVERQQRALEEDVRKKRAESERMGHEISKLKQGLVAEEANLQTAKNKRAIRQKMAKYRVEIQDLESEVVVLERSIDRILLVRAKHALETE